MGHGVTNEQLGERRRNCSEKVETHPTDTLASPDESAMNSWRSSENSSSTSFRDVGASCTLLGAEKGTLGSSSPRKGSTHP